MATITILLCLGQILDIISTLLCINKGAIEVNMFMNGILNNSHIVFILFKSLFAIILPIAFAFGIKYTKLKFTKVLLIVASILSIGTTFYAVINNFINIIRY